ncbi:MAG: hypothetical protein GY943_08685 [Chloroflexi bacterium]|nr:hypothetical protein [Chloroflexota bacterium]
MPEPTETPLPTDTPAPTETPIPTETAVPILPIEIADELADDGCTLVTINPESWSPLYAAYTGGNESY